ncbi:TRAP transporter large permease [Desulfatiglans anilini]|uniref:TRAP transporter large permease n=1 Tax=Desulfatiglans anilini TaxID=90728 RepID=UPI000412948C|nr:TRAP transporter large permease subunit [Desulfatiglans anilini]
MTVLILLLLGLLLMGLPLFAGILVAAMLGFHAGQVPLTVIAVEIDRLANAPVLLAIPLFTFTGYLLAQGGTSARFVRLSQSLLGWLSGGLGIVALVTCALFTALTGATGITIVALGGLLLPMFLRERYPERFSLGLLTISGSVGIHFPPSLPVILYGFVAGVQIEKLFLAGLLPGLLLLAVPCAYALWSGRRSGGIPRAFSLGECLAALRGAAWELPLPFLILFGIYSGLSTATEAAALAVVYVLAVKILVFRELDPCKELPRIMVESMQMVGAIMIVLAAALAFTSYMVDAFIPARVLEFLQGTIQSRLGFLIVLNLFLIAVGCLMDIFSAILVIVPLVAPLAARFGIDPFHLGVVFLANLAIGYNTPPVGLNLFIASARFKRPVIEVYRAALPWLILLLLVLLVITYWPALSLFLL